MKTILFVVCCLWLSAYSRKDYDCQEYMEGNVNTSSISYVEILSVAEPFEMVTVFFRDNFPCHKHRSWFGGFQRIRSFAAEAVDPIQSDNETCINYLNLTWDIIIEKALLSPNSDVIFTQIDSYYSSVRPICVKNKTAHYIKLQQDTTCDPIPSTSCSALSIVSTYAVPCSPMPLFSTVTIADTSTIIVTTTVTVGTNTGNSSTNDTCTYILPLLSTTLGVLSSVLIFIIIAMFIYIRCKKHTGKSSKIADNIHASAKNPGFEAHEGHEQE